MFVVFSHVGHRFDHRLQFHQHVSSRFQYRFPYHIDMFSIIVHSLFIAWNFRKPSRASANLLVLRLCSSVFIVWRKRARTVPKTENDTE